MKKVLKLSAIFIIALTILSFATASLAAGPENVGEIKTSDSFDDIGKTIIGGIQAVGSVAAIAVLAVLGVKYMLGSAEEKAEYKKTMLPYIIGAILVFAAANIANMVYDFAQDVGEEAKASAMLYNLATLIKM